MDWVKVDEHAFYSSDEKADVFLTDGYWILDLDGDDTVYKYLSKNNAMEGYEILIRTGVIEDDFA